MSNNRVLWLTPDDPPERFPPVRMALREPDGLIAAGGDLAPERLLYAYRNGIFPWYDEGQPLLWWSPDPRCVFLPGDYHLSRRLGRHLKQSNAEIRFNTAFDAVLAACAGPRRSEQGTWITPAMKSAYATLHHLGWAHSIEIWQDGELVGGLYGLAIGKAFFGESMFSQTPNTSKIALLYLASRLSQGDFELIDCQVISSHLMQLGASTLSRDDFVQRLDIACKAPDLFEDWPSAPLPCKSLFSI